jgi:hypothetical protein
LPAVSAFSRALTLQNIGFHHIISTPTQILLGAMETVASPSEGAETFLFRPAKKRKIYRQRALDDVPNPTSPPPGPSQAPDPVLSPVSMDDAPSTNEELEGTRVSMSEILRLRKVRKHRVGGVEFRASTVNVRDDGQDGALVLHESSRADEEGFEAPQGVGVARRFAKQTGMVGDVDKHM